MSVATGFIGVLILFILLALRVPVALALIAVPVGGIAWLLGWTPAIGLLSSTPFSFVANWTLSAVPMFLLMGFIAFHTGMTGGLFDAAKAVLRRVPGALAISSIFACSGFAAVCGSSLATAAAMGRIAIPEMVKSGYSPSFATGSIAAGGTIGALIPPSILMIVYGVFAETSVIKVFVGGVSIGLLTALAYTIVVLLTCWLRPDIAPPRPLDAGEIDTKKAVLEIWPVLLLMAIVFGGLLAIYRIIHSPFGQVLKAIRDNEPRSISLGYKVNRYKLAVFVMSATIAGMAGSTKALVFQLSSLTDVYWTMSGEVVLMTLLGGMGTIFGPFVGAAVIVTMQNYFAGFGAWVTVLQGTIFVISVLLFREGIVGVLSRWIKKPL